MQRTPGRRRARFARSAGQGMRFSTICSRGVRSTRPPTASAGPSPRSCARGGAGRGRAAGRRPGPRSGSAARRAAASRARCRPAPSSARGRGAGRSPPPRPRGCRRRSSRSRCRTRTCAGARVDVLEEVREDPRLVGTAGAAAREDEGDPAAGLAGCARRSAGASGLGHGGAGSRIDRPGAPHSPRGGRPIHPAGRVPATRHPDVQRGHAPADLAIARSGEGRATY